MLSSADRKQQSDSPSRSGLELAAIVLLLAGWGLEVTSMGRGPEEDPVFFAAAAAAGTLAGRLARP